MIMRLREHTDSPGRKILEECTLAAFAIFPVAVVTIITCHCCSPDTLQRSTNYSKTKKRSHAIWETKMSTGLNGAA
jgi:hypothetical protein